MQKIIVWICNGVVGLLSILAIVCYFFGPVWQISVSVPVTPNDLTNVIGPLGNLELEENLKDGFDIELSLNVDMKLVLDSFSADAENTAQNLVDSNVDGIIDKLSLELGDIIKAAMRAVAGDVVKDELNNQLKDFLSKNSDGSYTDSEISQKLEAAGITEEYISEKTGALFDAIYSGDTTVNEIGDMIVDTISDVYGKLSQSGDIDFLGAELSMSDMDTIKQSVSDLLGQFAAEDGTFNPDEILDRVLLEAMKALNEGGFGVLSVAPVSENSVRDELKTEVGKYIKNAIPSEVTSVIVLVLRSVLVLIALSALTWVYTIVKIVVKFFAKDPTVKLKLPILLGWLPFLVLVCLPALGLWAVGLSSLTAPGGPLEMMTAIGISFGSIGWIALAVSIVCIIMSVFYAVMRKQLKKNEQ